MKRLRKGVQLLESGPLEDLAAVQSRLAWQVLRHLAPETTPSQKEFLRELPPVRLDAMENYTRGLLASGPEQKQRFFAQAARLDAGFSDPRYELGRLYWERKEYAQAASWFESVRPTAPRYLECNFLLGLCRYSTGDYAAAQAAFERVADSVPLNEVFNNLGAAQSRRHLPEALASFERALEGDAADPDYHFNRGYALWKLNRFEDAATSFRAALERDPEDAEATLMLGRALKRSGPALGEAGLERIKLNYQEGAYRQLKAALESLKRR
jgi:tetratricopeptide (TPR) repeat protein